MADESKDENQSRVEKVQAILDAGEAPPIVDQSPNYSQDTGILNAGQAPPIPAHDPTTDPNSPSYIAPQNVPGSSTWKAGRNVNVQDMQPDRLIVPDPSVRGGQRSIPNPNAGKPIALNPAIQGNSPLLQAPNTSTPTLTAPPAAATGQPSGQPNPNDAALNAFLQPRPAPAPHATKLDRDYLDNKMTQANEMSKSIDAAVARTQSDAEAYHQNSSALANDSEIGRMIMQKQLQDESKQRASILQEHQQAQSKINSKLDELEASGIDPKKYYRDAGTATNIAQAINVGLTQFGQGLARRNGNPVVDMINSSIEKDIDAQKANMEKNYKVLNKRYDVENSGFDAKVAMLKAESESTMTAYTVAQRDIERRAAMNKDDANVQSEATRMSQQLDQFKQAKMGELADRQYSILKQYDRQAGPGGPDVKAIREAATKIVMESKGQVSDEEALSRAAHLLAGVNNRPAGSPNTSWETKKEDKNKGGNVDLEGFMAQNPNLSTNWEPQRGIQGTGAQQNVLKQQDWNSEVRLAALQKGVTQRAVENAIKDLTINPTDSEETVRFKQTAAIRKFGKNAPAITNPSGLNEDK